MEINKKILKYLKHKGVSQYEFSKKTKLSDGLLRKGKSISSDKLSIVRNIFPDLNMNWLIYDEGKMILEEELNGLNEHAEHYGLQNDYKEKYLELAERHIKLQDDLIGYKENTENLVKDVLKNMDSRDIRIKNILRMVSTLTTGRLDSIKEEGNRNNNKLKGESG